MPSNGHALLSASSSHRWLNCPRSVTFIESTEDKQSEFALEGSEAHLLCEFRLRQALGIDAENPIPRLTQYSNEMEDYANEYVSYILELIEEVSKTCKDPVYLIEQRVDYSRFVEDGFGTADFILISDGSIWIVDFKYGRGIKVEAKENSQMMIYALGALELFDLIYDIENVNMTIFQPRIGNISTSSMTKTALYDWAENVLIPTAQLALEGNGEFKAGSWCQFCKLKTTCRKRMEENMKLAKLDFTEPPLLTDDEIEEVLIRIDELVLWADSVKDYALKEALKGKIWSQFKLVEGKSNRKFTDETKIAEVVHQAGFDPFEKRLLGITDMQKLLGKSKFEELLSPYIIKPQGKPTLVPLSDKREPLKIMTIQEEFKNVN